MSNASIFNNNTLVVEESIHVTFDESNHKILDPSNKDDENHLEDNEIDSNEHISQNKEIDSNDQISQIDNFQNNEKLEDKNLSKS